MTPEKITNDLRLVQDYIRTIEKELAASNATEHTHRSALKTLIEDTLPGTVATNEPRRIECGAPDFIITKDSATIGYIEAKDVGKSLDETEKSEQLHLSWTQLCHSLHLFTLVGG
jgi:hypothetical protein